MSELQLKLPFTAKERADNQELDTKIRFVQQLVDNAYAAYEAEDRPKKEALRVWLDDEWSIPYAPVKWTLPGNNPAPLFKDDND